MASLLTDRGARAVIVEHSPAGALDEYRRLRTSFLNDTAIPAWLTITDDDCEASPIAGLMRILDHIAPSRQIAKQNGRERRHPGLPSSAPE